MNALVPLDTVSAPFLASTGAIGQATFFQRTGCLYVLGGCVQCCFARRNCVPIDAECCASGVRLRMAWEGSLITNADDLTITIIILVMAVFHGIAGNDQLQSVRRSTGTSRLPHVIVLTNFASSLMGIVTQIEESVLVCVSKVAPFTACMTNASTFEPRVLSTVFALHHNWHINDPVSVPHLWDPNSTLHLQGGWSTLDFYPIQDSRSHQFLWRNW